jgi:hypothetical protein
MAQELNVTQLVVHGQIVDPLGLCQQRSTIVHPGEWPQKVETRVRSFALPPESFRRHQDAVRLNLEHDRRNVVGRLVGLEHGPDGVWACFTSDELSLLRDVATPWYLSGEVAWRGSDVNARDAELRSVALVRESASTGIRPVEILLGDLSRRYDRQRWQLKGLTRDRIERAAEQLKYRRPDDPVTLYEAPAKVTPVAGGWLVGDELVRSGRPAGRIRHWPAAGDGSSIISVR